MLYLLLNWSYTTAVFTPPGSTTNDQGYSSLPTHGPPRATSFTVKANGEIRFCKKCQARKPDRAHHCSTCRRCVLKMDHHCPWLATCIGLRNHKAFLLFLIYTTVFALYCFAVSGSWAWTEINSNNTNYVDSFMPVQFIMLCVISGIIGLVVGAFTGWHIMLASKGQTTIECLEKTRYLSPLRRTMHQTYNAQHSGRGVPLPAYGQQLLDLHQNALPGITRPEEGEDEAVSSRSSTPLQPLASGGGVGGPTLSAEEQMGRRVTYDEMERYRARKRHEEYMDEQDSEKLPNAFDLGVKRNLLHLFGPSPWLWFLPICNTTGDGWAWEASPRWVEARDRIGRERSDQRARERAAGWGQDTPLASPAWQQQQQQPQPPPPQGHYAAPTQSYGQYLQPSAPPAGPGSGRRTPSKADRVLGRDPNLYVDEVPSSVNMRRLSPMGRELDDDNDEDGLLSSDDEESKPTSSVAETAPLVSPTSGTLNLGPNGRYRGSASGLLRKPSQPGLRGDEAGRSSSGGGGGGGGARGSSGADDGVD